MGFFYKAAATQIAKDGEIVGVTVFTKDFNSLQKAESYAKDHILSPLSIIEVRKYDADKTNIVDFSGHQDTGRQILRDVSGIETQLIQEFEVALKEDKYWDSTMSCMIDCIKGADPQDPDPTDWDYLKDAVNLLTDEETNGILAYDGSDEYMICVDGKIVEAPEEELE